MANCKELTRNELNTETRQIQGPTNRDVKQDTGETHEGKVRWKRTIKIIKNKYKET